MKKILAPFILMICWWSLVLSQSNFNSTILASPVKADYEFGFARETYELYLTNRKQQVEFIQRTRNFFLAPGKTEIILEARNLYGDNHTGYQLLLDADHDTYGEIFFDNSLAFYGGQAGYDRFEYKIPTNADPVAYTQNAVIDGEEKVEIPAGTYDYVLLTPRSEGIGFVYGTFSRQNDFLFQGGYTYRFRILLEDYPSIGKTNVARLLTDKDAEAGKLILPSNSAALTAAEPVTLVIINNGTQAISDLPVTYQVNGGEIVNETYKRIIQPQDTVEYTFTRKADFSAKKTYSVETWVTLEGDLVKANDRIKGSCRHYETKQLPYTEDFSSQENFNADWTLTDNDGNGSGWLYMAWLEGPDGKTGAAGCPGRWDGDKTNDDYLISLPIHLEAGTHHLTFYTKTILNTGAELLDVRYGTTPDGTKMTILGDYKIQSLEWREKLINFQVTVPGTYYFAFHTKSQNGLNLHLDNIKIDKGKLEGIPDLAFREVIVPYSSCGMSDRTSLGAIVINKGTGKISSLSLTYTLNNEEPVTQTFEGILEPDTEKQYIFSTTADLSTPGDYRITLSAQTEGETNKYNNSDTASITHFEPVTELPRTTDFQEGLNTDDWFCRKEGVWTKYYDGGYTSMNGGKENALISRCYTLPEGQARIQFKYNNGNYRFITFYIAYGKSGTDISQWDTIHYETQPTQETYKTQEITFDIKETGDYSFAVICPNEITGNLVLYSFTISSLLPSDIAIKRIETPFSEMTPLSQASATCTYLTEIENRGLKQVTGVKTSLWDASGELFVSSGNTTIESKESTIISMQGKLSTVQIGDRLQLTMHAIMDEEDTYPDDNAYQLSPYEVTDTIFATEHITDNFDEATGMDGMIASFGNIYTLNVADTLTSLSIGLAKIEPYNDPIYMGIAIYSLEEDGLTIRQELFSQTIERKAGGEERTIPVPARILIPGKYYFEVKQLTRSMLGITFEKNTEAVFYQNTGNVLTPVQNFGALYIRANFGHGANAPKKDLTPVALLKPEKKKALYTSETLLEASIMNNGSEALSACKVYFEFNGQQLNTEIDHLNAYETKTAAVTADLSTPGEYIIKIYTSLNGDEVSSNDTLFVPIISVPSADPYKLDFEFCDNFAVNGEFNPNWRSADLTGERTDSWMTLYPHFQEPVGFIAFNPLLTDPVMSPDIFPDFQPYNGERFGTAFVPFDENQTANTWLISPKLTLKTNSSLEMYVKSPAKRYTTQPEKYKILISDTDDEYDSFKIIGEERQAPAEKWTKVETDLSEYDNKDVYIAIQYISESASGIALLVDDIHIKTFTNIENTDNADDLSFYVSENLLTIETENISITSVSLYDVSGSLLYHRANTNIENRYFRLSMENYRAGIYIVKVGTSKGMKTFKFCITR